VVRLPPEFVAEQLAADAQRAYDRREAGLGAELMRELEFRVSLAIIDRARRDHVRAVEELQAIRVGSRGGVDPLPEYQREAALLFRAMRTAASTEPCAHCLPSRWIQPSEMGRKPRHSFR
jgi:preprotein translocase subunit SecA